MDSRCENLSAPSAPSTTKMEKRKRKRERKRKNAVARKEATTTPRRIRLLHADECRKRAKSRKAIKTGRMREREREKRG